MRLISALISGYIAGCVAYILVELIIVKFDMSMFLQIAKDSLLWGKFMVNTIQAGTFFSSTSVLVATICAVLSFASNLKRKRND